MTTTKELAEAVLDALREPEAAAREISRLRADWERECADTDTVLRALKLDPETCRTDGGSLIGPRIVERIKELEKDAIRLTWLGQHPRESSIRVGETFHSCTFWGLAAAPGMDLRSVIDAAMKAAKEPTR